MARQRHHRNTRDNKSTYPKVRNGIDKTRNEATGQAKRTQHTNEKKKYHWNKPSLWTRSDQKKRENGRNHQTRATNKQKIKKPSPSQSIVLQSIC